MALLVLIVMGALFGWLASIIVRTEEVAGIMKNVGFGLAGSLIAGLIVNGGSMLGGLGLTALGVAALTAVVLLAVYNLVFVIRF